MTDIVLTPFMAPPKGNSLAVEDRRIRGFDGLRAIAFLLVFASHKIDFAQAGPIGDVGVWLFFVLSGFLITRILARSRDEIESGQATISNRLGRFYLRRTARIMPPYYLLLAVVAAISFFVPIDHFSRSEKLAYLLYSTNFMIAARGYWPGDFGHFWSLAIEEQFYLLFAPLVLLVPRKYTMSVCLAIISAGIATKIALEVRNASAVSIDVTSLINFSLLGFGGVIGLSAIRAAPKWFVGGAAQLAVLCLYLVLPATLGTSPHVWPLLGKLSAVLVGVLLFQIFHGQQSWFVTALESSPLQKLGRISYGAYLVHHFINFSAFENFLRQYGVEATAPRPVQVLAELTISLFLAAISWRYFEKIIIAWAARLTSGNPHNSQINDRSYYSSHALKRRIEMQYAQLRLTAGFWLRDCPPCAARLYFNFNRLDKNGMMALAKTLARRAGLRRKHVAAVRMMVERNTLAILAQPRQRAGGRILCYHSIDEREYGVNNVRSNRFRHQIEFALASGYRFVPAAEIALNGGSQWDLAVTFDDGRKSVLTRAAAILKEYGIPWSLFVVTTWTDESETAVRAKNLSWRELERLMEAGVEIGSHSCTHPDFAKIELQQMVDELSGSRLAIQKNLGFAPISMAIPLGQSMNWPVSAANAAREAGYEIVYAQAEDTRPADTIPRTFVTRFDMDHIFSALLSGAYDRWEEWT
jgi:peptidoglycan/LPS O-acetylase OafA/YrhL/peptidoglycan/xylan/chitin deacetylase (PgdA/CDA1 family)